MGWYRCSCGYMTEATPRFGDTIVSVYHLHRAARVDRSSSIEWMEKVPDPVLACAVVGQEARYAVTATGARSLRLSPTETQHPKRRAA